MTPTIRTDYHGTPIFDNSTDGSHPGFGNFVVSGPDLAFFGGALYERVDGVKHPTAGTFVLSNGGKAYYGGVAYQRRYAPQAPTAPASKYPVGTRVLLRNGKQTRHAFDGAYGTVTEALNTPPGYDVSARPDGYDFDVWFYDDEVTEAPPAPAEPQPKFKRGDKVVYTIPETFGEFAGIEGAQRPSGVPGVVVKDSSDVAVLVTWGDDPYPKNTAIEFVAPTPTHKHPEGLYRSGSESTATHIVVRHEAEPETYRFLYVSVALDGEVSPVNSGMTKLTELGYTLVTEFPA